jgi:hypothetical protein
LIAFASSQVFALTLLALAGAGLMDTVYGTARNTIVQLAADERLRGRVMGLQVLANRGLGPSGSFVTGALATLVGAPLAVGSLALVATGLMLWRGLGYRPLRDFQDG